MKQFFKDIMTTKDGESYDVVRVALTGVILFLPACLVWGIGLFTYGYLASKPFDIASAYNPSQRSRGDTEVSFSIISPTAQTIVIEFWGGSNS